MFDRPAGDLGGMVVLCRRSVQYTNDITGFVKIVFRLGEKSGREGTSVRIVSSSGKG